MSQFSAIFPQFSAIFPQFSRNFSQLVSTPPPPDRNSPPPAHRPWYAGRYPGRCYRSLAAVSRSQLDMELLHSSPSLPTGTPLSHSHDSIQVEGHSAIMLLDAYTLWHMPHPTPAVMVVPIGAMIFLVSPSWPEPTTSFRGSMHPLPPKLVAEFGRLRRFVLPICWVSESRRFALPICSVSVILPICSANSWGFCDFAASFCRLWGFWDSRTPDLEASL